MENQEILFFEGRLYEGLIKFAGGSGTMKMEDEIW